ncbi:hypothetical protein EHQ52_13745 [Leptospira koniambonensis]|uniref:Uncharacterized protein n=1 Tax=Leptospira koniambonensis TaxID=2484950 RepID=A0A4R9J684_9LEPT|nr:hypothetical protein [Leptospira koniambonensis]TGL32360.1 hypothetical protein EHQ52_13745 [Leptospira koniambonensis]
MNDYKQVFSEAIRNKYLLISFPLLLGFIFFITSDIFTKAVYGEGNLYVIPFALSFPLPFIFFYLKALIQLTLHKNLDREISFGKIFGILSIYAIIYILLRMLLGSIFTGIISMLVVNANSEFILALNSLASDFFFVFFQGGAAIILGSRGIKDLIYHFILLLSNKKSFLHLFILFLIPGIFLLSKSILATSNQYLIPFVFIILTFIYTIGFLVLTRHWQKLEAIDVIS